ncbi:hypothetical protein V6N11_004995 [Hibiscus sabdariffa]|uniref:Uncharacterized protein n=1 Tax=Hibiscus sabdariffa TaxID=183260 RepID=A0ABR2NHT5_9ROSI
MENHKENPTEDNIEPQDGTCGRPPDTMVQVGLPIALEQLDLHEGFSDMEPDSNGQVADVGAQVPKVSATGLDHGCTSDGKVTYAKMSGFPTIKFSDRVHDQIDQNMKNVIIVANEDKVAEFVEITKVPNDSVKGVKNVAYRESNPDRCSKHNVNKVLMAPNVDVISLVTWSEIAVDTHTIASTSGHHRAFSIQEKVGEGKSGSRPKISNVSSNRGKGLKENNSKGLRIQKGAEFHPPSRVMLADWVQSATNRIQSDTNTIPGRTCQGSAMEDDGK